MLTKKDLQNIDELVDTKINLRFKHYTNIVVEKLDKVMDELENIREDNAMALEKDNTFDKTLKNHEKRLQKVETHLHISTIPA